jgi:enolase-phosphatase E1
MLPKLRQEWVANEGQEGQGDPAPSWLFAPGSGAERRDENSSPSGDVEHAGRSASLAVYIERLMDQDRKSSGLKLLQGQMWDEGYRSGELEGEVFPDVAPALRRWRNRSTTVAMYSSGSELAQRLLFGTTADGDLTPLISRFFDTAVGAKQAVESYRRIARELGTPPEEMLYISDVSTELDAARSAGCRVRLCVRPGNRPQPAHDHAVIQSFEDIA